MSDAGSNRRQKAAAAREQAASAEKRRERTIRIVGAVTVLVVVVGIIGIALVARGSSSSGGGAAADPTAAADPAAKAPAGVLPAGDEHAFGVLPYGAKAGVPVLAIWEDFQCPACKAVEEANGTGIEQLAKDGKVQLVWRPTAFLDKNLGNDSSSRAIAAFGCAVDQGKAVEFHNVVFANQPEQEGAGYTQEQLIAFGSDAGVADTAAFTSCVENGTYLAWAANTTKAFYDSAVPGTPYGTLNGIPVEAGTLADAALLEKAVADAAAGTLVAPSPAAS